MTQRSKKKLDTIAFLGTLLALIGFFYILALRHTP